jgi:hypothetical protein
MNQADNKTSLTIGVPGLILQPVGSMLVGGNLGYAITLVGTVLLITGLCYYARAKGYHMAFGALGLLSCVGLVILAVLPDQRKGESPANWH